jgi:hypothetical protein
MGCIGHTKIQYYSTSSTACSRSHRYTARSHTYTDTYANWMPKWSEPEVEVGRNLNKKESRKMAGYSLLKAK